MNLVIGSVLAFGCCIAITAAASTSEAQSALRGVVQADASSRRLIVAAELANARLGRVARSNHARRYVLDSLLPASYEVVVRAIGYCPLVISLILGDAHTADLNLALTRSAVELPTRRARIAPQGSRGAPADDPSRQSVDHKRHVHETTPRRHVRQIGHSQLVRLGRLKGPLHEIARPLHDRIRDCRPDAPPAHHAAQPQLAHQPRSRGPGDPDLFAVELLPHLLRAIQPAERRSAARSACAAPRARGAHAVSRARAGRRAEPPRAMIASALGDPPLRVNSKGTTAA